MKEILPGIGQKSAGERLDELFSRDVLGSVLFGAAVSKVVEKLNMIATAAIIVYFFNIEVTQSVRITAVVLLMWWALELVFFIFLYIRWDRYMQALAEKAEQQKENIEEKKKQVEEKTKKEEADVKIKLFGREFKMNIDKSGN